MQTKDNINNSILAITADIDENYPELSGFLGEMPVTIPASSNPVITTESLASYKDSLKALLTKYVKNKSAQ